MSDCRGLKEDNGLEKCQIDPDTELNEIYLI